MTTPPRTMHRRHRQAGLHTAEILDALNRLYCACDMQLWQYEPDTLGRIEYETAQAEAKRVLGLTRKYGEEPTA